MEGAQEHGRGQADLSPLEKGRRQGTHLLLFPLRVCGGGAKQKLREASPPLEILWDEFIRDLVRVRTVAVDLHDRRYLLRTPLNGHAVVLFAAIGVWVPPLAQSL